MTDRSPPKTVLTEAEISVLALAFEHAPFEFWIRDADGVCLVLNAAARRWGDFRGMRVEESNGHPDVIASWVANNVRAYAGETVQNEIEHQVDGETRTYQVMVIPIRAGEQVKGILGFNIDLTDHKRAERALREALRVGRMGYLDWNLLTNQIWWSPETYRLFGHAPGSFDPTIESTVGMVPDEDRALVQTSLEEAIRGTIPYDVDHRMIRGDGEVIHVHAQGEVMRDEQGRALRLLGTVIDVTDRVRAEEALREMDRRRNEFLGVLSHELRNPLAIIRSSLYNLEHESVDTRRGMAIIDRQTHQLTRLVDDLLDVTRISSGKVRLQHERLDLVELVRHTIEDHRAQLGSRGLRLTLPDEPSWIRGDAIRLSQVVGNLLSNAAKYTLETEQVSVSLTRTHGRAVLEVADTGLGIDAETLPTLFVPFNQADRSLDRSQGGLGLGLALVKSLVEAHGGTVTARSDGPGRGSCFTIQLLLDDSAPAELTAPDSPTTIIGRRMLVIEDNQDAADSLAIALKFAGHDVTIAFDGVTGLAKAREIDPEVILCDIGLPGGMDGYAVARALQNDARLANSFRIALTGYGRPEDQQKARDAGFDAHFTKPPDLHALNRLLTELPERPR